MASATLAAPKPKSNRRSSMGIEVSGNYRLKHISKTRVQQALGQPIEYVVGDWSQLSEPEHECQEQPEPRRLSAAEEAALFRRMNYLKHQADQLRQEITRDNCTPDMLDEIEHRLDESTRLRNYLVQVFSKLACFCFLK